MDHLRHLSRLVHTVRAAWRVKHISLARSSPARGSPSFSPLRSFRRQPMPGLDHDQATRQYDGGEKERDRGRQRSDHERHSILRRPVGQAGLGIVRDVLADTPAIRPAIARSVRACTNYRALSRSNSATIETGLRHPVSPGSFAGPWVRSPDSRVRSSKSGPIPGFDRRSVGFVRRFFGQNESVYDHHDRLWRI